MYSIVVYWLTVESYYDDMIESFHKTVLFKWMIPSKLWLQINKMIWFYFLMHDMHKKFRSMFLVYKSLIVIVVTTNKECKTCLKLPQ